MWTWGHSPLALAGVQDEFLVAPGADSQLVRRGVANTQEQVALPGAVGKTTWSSVSRAAMARALPLTPPRRFPTSGGRPSERNQNCHVPLNRHVH